MQAIVPKNEVPALPEGMTGWVRSSRRGSMYHAHALGVSACRSMTFERHKSHEHPNLADMQFWGVCPRCYRLATKEKTDGR